MKHFFVFLIAFALNPLATLFAADLPTAKIQKAEMAGYPRPFSATSKMTAIRPEKVNIRSRESLRCDQPKAGFEQFESPLFTASDAILMRNFQTEIGGPFDSSLVMSGGFSLCSPTYQHC